MELYPGIVVTRTSTAEQIADGLTRMIMSGAIAPGTKVKETVIAASMGISRNTVREAVRLLEQGGLVRHKMYKGTVVVEPSTEEARELYAARSVLELAAVRVPIIGEQLERIEAEFQRLQELCEVDPPVESQEIVAQDLAFHAAIVATLGSQRINELYTQVAKELRFYLMVLSHDESPAHVAKEHEEILEHIRAGDLDGAVREVAEHNSRNGANVERLIASRGGS